MDTMDKAERLRERANVTYEEAKAALDEAEGDLLDAMVILEKQGKTNPPGKESYSTTYEEQTNYIRVLDKVNEQQSKRPNVGKSLREIVRRFFVILRNNSFCISRKGNEIFSLPAWIFALILLAAWKTAIPVMIVALFFGIRYSFSGPDDSSRVNHILDKVGNLADDVKEEFH